MDWSAVTKDVQELVEEFSDIGGTELSQMKFLWSFRSFSFIHEARPKDVTPAFFMQTLYSCALGHIVHGESLCSKLGGLYILYMLFETQQYEPPFLIYISPEELEALIFLVKEIEAKSIGIALRVVKRMLDKNLLLLGSVNVNQKHISATVDKLESQASASVQHARIRLLSNVPLEDHLRGSLVKGLELDELSRICQGYAQTKEQVFTEHEGVQEGVKTGWPNVADELWKEADDWESWKQGVYGGNIPISPIQVQDMKEDYNMQEDNKPEPLV
ncbi:hypothetical protein O6H91_15G067200 [Diphasiastrum complanatum]|uniref:Uncharacterized protein n=1 Tax=Diphasiastrum complanatum TaxID=34168 RepID=A0ACC2BJ68_DIPCM|nr:hypothetical protein O6H91_15G067200 [Diphasiastrum complanatum]